MTVTYTVSDLIQETHRHLYGSGRSEQNRLTSTITSGATTLAVDFPLQAIQRGAYLGIEDEIVYVWSVTSNTQTVTACARGQLGTMAASHTSGTIVEVNPRFPTFSIRLALREEIRSWGPQLFRVGNATVQTSDQTRGYDLGSLPSSFYQIFDVQRTGVLATGQPDPHNWPRVRFKVMRNANLTDFPSGNAIVLSSSGYSSTGQLPKLNVVYSYPFDVDTAFVDATDVISAVGLDTSMIDIAPIGAAWRLLSTRDIRRTFTESAGQPADLKEVPVGSIGAVANQLKRLRDARLSEEALQLRSRYPYTMGF